MKNIVTRYLSHRLAQKCRSSPGHQSARAREGRLMVSSRTRQSSKRVELHPSHPHQCICILWHSDDHQWWNRDSETVSSEETAPEKRFWRLCTRHKFFFFPIRQDASSYKNLSELHRNFWTGVCGRTRFLGWRGGVQDRAETQRWKHSSVQNKSQIAPERRSPQTSTWRRNSNTSNDSDEEEQREAPFVYVWKNSKSSSLIIEWEPEETSTFELRAEDWHVSSAWTSHLTRMHVTWFYARSMRDDMKALNPL